MSDAARDAGCQFLLRKLGSLVPLDGEEAEAIRTLPMTVEACPAEHALVREWDRPASCHLILDGFACRHKSLPDAGRQILSFHTPGDIPDLQSLYLGTMDYGVSTTVPTLVGRIAPEALYALAHRHPGIARAFWRDTLVDAAIYREWMLGLGRRTARNHLARLLCEVVIGLRVVLPDTVAVGAMPLPQKDLADALGLTVVEINRQLHGLWLQGLIGLGTLTVTVTDFDRLAGLCGFDPAYLSQGRAA